MPDTAEQAAVIGQTISHYRIVKKLGGGGMGLVYEGEDTRLGRRVALKFIPENVAGNGGSLDRFILEARATSSLNHPNICTIFDIESHDGLPFIVMELLQGQSLQDRLVRGPLDAREALDITIQIADALDAAHAQGIVHRDVKPGNIFLTNRGQAKILDFGLAKLAPDQTLVTACTATESDGNGAHAPRHRPSEALTETSVIPGTTMYMSPEQARCEPIDARSDLFSLGTVLYETVTGQKPFLARTSVLALAAIQHQKPVSPSTLNPSLPARLEAIIGKLLEKDRDKRYQSAGALANDLRALKQELELQALGLVMPVHVAPSRTFRKLSLRQIYALVGIAAALVMILLVVTVWWAKHGRTSGPVAANNTIVVLPFNNVSGDPDTDYLRFAVPDQLVKILAYTPSLEIRPVPSGAKYLQGNFDPQQAGRELHAANVVTGHYMSQGDRLIITLDDVDTRFNRLVWQGTVTVPTSNLLTLQEQLAAQVRDGLLPALGAQTSLLASATQPHDPTAYDLYLRGSALPHDPAPNSTALTMLERSVELDPKFAPALDALGLRYYYESQYSGAGQEAVQKSVAAYEKALALDPNLISSAAHLIRLRAEAGAIGKAYKEAADLVKRRPENAQALFTLAYSLRYAGLLHDAAQDCDAAVTLDPGNYDFRSCSFVFFELGNTKRALEYVRLDSGSDWAASVLPAILVRENKRDEARVAAAKISSRPAWYGGLLQSCLKPVPQAEMHKLAGSAAAGILAQRDPEFRYYHGSLLAWCGEEETAAQLIGSAIEQNYCSNTALHDDPALAKLRETPFFAPLAAQARQCQDRFTTETGRR
ncbi:MAG: protein kinase domain-containing protein [Terriglobales bacterium]